MQKQTKAQLKAAFFVAAVGILIIVTLIICQSYGLVSFVDGGRQTFLGNLLFLFAWPSLSALVIGVFQQASGGSLALASIFMVAGILLNLLYFLGIGYLGNILLQKTKPF